MTEPRAGKRRLLTVALELLLLAGIVVGVSAYQTRHHVGSGPAPDFTLLDLDGRRVALREHRGKKVLLHFWATWCGVCRLELASLKGLQGGLDADEVLLTVVEDSDDIDAVRSFAREHELTYPILLGTPETLRAYRVTSFPTNYYIDAGGSVGSTSVGLSTRLGMSLRLWRVTGE